jgi:hypothetical protein
MWEPFYCRLFWNFSNNSRVDKNWSFSCEAEIRRIFALAEFPAISHIVLGARWPWLRFVDRGCGRDCHKRFDCASSSGYRCGSVVIGKERRRVIYPREKRDLSLSSWSNEPSEKMRELCQQDLANWKTLKVLRIRLIASRILFQRNCNTVAMNPMH